MRDRGNCYVASEALYHILGGKAAGWDVYRAPSVTYAGKPETHWWLQHRATGVVLDPSRLQFPPSDLPDIYADGRRTGFLTKGPSRRARALMRILTWQTAY